ncbi:Uncharacterized protein TCM_028403 [Theobroma cacao]|uniref:Uncharacterized protein n=1 Tax=Theobroma cacao TaxID=3641 RepID=A0A061GHP3_THECC|nr:Uncharacterized protein TCM_028403 [Theobroma cacao]
MFLNFIDWWDNDELTAMGGFSWTSLLEGHSKPRYILPPYEKRGWITPEANTFRVHFTPNHHMRVNSANANEWLCPRATIKFQLPLRVTNVYRDVATIVMGSRGVPGSDTTRSDK